MIKQILAVLSLCIITLPLYGGHLAVSLPDKTEPIGETKAHLEKAYTRLCSPPLSDLVFALSDISFAYKRRFYEYSGDVSGRLIGALHAAETVLGVTPALLPQMMGQLKNYQKSDGHFGVDQNLALSIDQSRDMPILWGNGRMLLALAEYCRDHPDPDVLAIAAKLGDYILSARPYYGKRENFEKVGGSAASGFTTCYPSLIDALTILSEVTKQQKYLDEARYIANLALMDKEFNNHHSHGRFTAYRGMLEIDRLQGTNDYTAEITRNLRTIKQKYQLPTGGITEMFDLTYPRDEACTESDWIRINFLLWQATGNNHYLDDSDYALRNHLYATQMSNGAFGHHVFNSLTEGNRKYPGGGISNTATDAYWCCCMHAAQILADTAKWSVVSSNNQYYVTWLSESKSEFKKGEQSFSISVSRKSPVSWVVELKTVQKNNIQLNLRVPSWASYININGEEQRVDNGWITIPCEWTGIQILNIHMPNQIRLAGTYQSQRNDKEPVRVLVGPDLYTLPLAAVSPEILSSTTVPQILFSEDSPVNEEIPVLIQGLNGKFQNAKLVPMAKRPIGSCTYLFFVRRVNNARFNELMSNAIPAGNPGKPKEILAASQGPYRLFMNNILVATGQGTDESPRITVYSNNASDVFDIITPGTMDKPGVIFHAECADKNISSTTAACTVVASDNPSPAKLQDSTETIELLDEGELGVKPWEHVPGHFFSIGAHWLWPKESVPAKKYYDFRFPF